VAGVLRSLCEAFPDLAQEVANIVAAGESAFAEAIARGTHSGPLETPDGEVPPTGRKIEIRFCVVTRAGRRRRREYYDSMTLPTQLGLMPETAETAS
jgi:predicted ester cyclase